MDAYEQPGVVELTVLHLGGKVSAVQQRRAVTETGILPGGTLAEHDKGVILVAGHAPYAAHTLDAVADLRPAHVPLPDMPAIEGDEIQVRAVQVPVQVQAQAHRPAQAHGGLSAVGEDGGAGDEVVLLAHAVEQLRLHAGAGVLQAHGQGLPALAAGEGGQALQGIFARTNLMARIAEIQQQAAVGLLHLRRTGPEVAYAAGGVLLGERIQRIGPVDPRLAGVGRKAAVKILDQAGQVVVSHAGTVVGMQQYVEGVGLHLIRRTPGVQRQRTAGFIVEDHNGPPGNVFQRQL